MNHTEQTTQTLYTDWHIDTHLLMRVDLGPLVIPSDRCVLFPMMAITNSSYGKSCRQGLPPVLVISWWFFWNSLFHILPLLSDLLDGSTIAGHRVNAFGISPPDLLLFFFFFWSPILKGRREECWFRTYLLKHDFILFICKVGVFHSICRLHCGHWILL